MAMPLSRPLDVMFKFALIRKHECAKADITTTLEHRNKLGAHTGLPGNTLGPQQGPATKGRVGITISARLQHHNKLEAKD